jgi:predicted component of viral defense system (DUF524 family)
VIYLHRIALAWSGGYRLEIECADTEPSSSLEQPLPVEAFDSANLESNPDNLSSPALCYCEDPDGFYEPIRLRENTAYVIAVTLPGSRQELQRQWEQSKSSATAWPFANPRLARVLQLMPSRYWQEVNSEGNVAVTVVGRINFGSFVGTVDLSLDATHGLVAEVACAKISYFDDFKALLQDISKDIVELLFEVDSVAGFRFEAEELIDRHPHPSVVLFHLRQLMAPDALPQAVEAIIQNPHTQLMEFTQFVNPSQAVHIDPKQVAQLAARLPYIEGGPVAGLFFGKSPIEIPEKIKRDTLDTPENRYIKAFLGELSNICYWLDSILGKEKKWASQREVGQWENVVDEWLSWPLWKEVGELSYVPSNSQVLQRRSGYREILEADIRLQYGLQLPWERGLEIADIIGDIRPVFELYEYWCYFALRTALKFVCGTESLSLGDFYIVKENRLHINLKRGRSSKLNFTYTESAGSIQVSLFYNRKFHKGQLDTEYGDGSYSTEFRPDFSILIENRGRRHWLHFDAKYRLNMTEWQRQMSEPSIKDLEQDLTADTEDGELYNKVDLHKMHTYRDAILGSRGAYVLFPGTGSQKSVFVRHPNKIYRGHYSIPSIGAFPLRPQSGDQQLNSVVAFLREVFTNLTLEASTYQDELGFPI